MFKKNVSGKRKDVQMSKMSFKHIKNLYKQ